MPCSGHASLLATGPGEAHIDWSGQYSGLDPRIRKGGAWQHTKQGAWVREHVPRNILDYTFNFLQSGAIWCNLGAKYCYIPQWRGLRTHAHNLIDVYLEYSMIMHSDVAHSLAGLSRRLEVHSTTPGQNSAYRACHSSGSFCLRGATSTCSPPPFPPSPCISPRY